MPTVSLTSLAHGGGCGCKLAPSVLRNLLAGQLSTASFQQLIVGTETGDDAAVWQIDDHTCIVATTDFFMPIVDDPADFGRIAATNAISDIYAMGAKPIMALAILGIPLGKLAIENVRAILDGGASVCARAGIPVAGGHSIDSPEPIYGLSVIGTCRPDQVRRNRNARSGDALILTKSIGIGVYSAAFKKGQLDDAGYAEMIASTTLLNSIGMTLSEDPAVHSMTDVTGFGLLGHALEMANGSNLSLIIDSSRVPFLQAAEQLAMSGFITGASKRNWSSYGCSINLPTTLPEWQRDLLTDPQTSGGLLIACSPNSAESLVAKIISAGNSSTRMIGKVDDGRPEVNVI
ncbi:selenide, water dikinase SelD [Bradyrhizobium sp. Ash2021]|uniref:selenide, water dikinase SelD n=1 Tax=Bradyrhizobium sp. Ash2021 TaxID=2954771 RepID=UPI00281594A7|nr:selenide, water dikinase SelD [Bradyrhizobium sp. Ash2021]WMT72057.1 selenide, water dikinase SelD [Bradyrhizobium sp. Ash2021]